MTLVPSHYSMSADFIFLDLGNENINSVPTPSVLITLIFSFVSLYDLFLWSRVPNLSPSYLFLWKDPSYKSVPIPSSHSPSEFRYRYPLRIRTLFHAFRWSPHRWPNRIAELDGVVDQIIEHLLYFPHISGNIEEFLEWKITSMDMRL